MKPQLISF